MSSPMNGQQIKQPDLDKEFLTGPGEDLIPKTLLQLSRVAGMITLFGKYIPPTGAAADGQQRWADYNRMDWSLRQLPAMNLYESGSEVRSSDQGFLNGQVTMMIFWPANFRRSDSRRIEAAFRGVINNFFSSKYVSDMLDELYYIQRDSKVYGLNEYGKTLNWTPNVEGLVEDKMVPVTMIEIPYRIDLRAWSRALEYMGRTVADPFEITLDQLTGIGVLADGSGYEGVDDSGTVQVLIEDEIDVSNP